MFIDDGVLCRVLPHRWQQVLHLTIREADLSTLLTKAQIAVMNQTATAPF